MRSVEQDLVACLVYLDQERAAIDDNRRNDSDIAWANFKDAATDFVGEHGPALLSALADQRRYRFMSESEACSLSISHNDHHNMYLSVEDTLDDSQGYYDDVPLDEKDKMIVGDSIWTVHIYPNTPVGFNVFHAATLDAAIDEAIADSIVPLDQGGE